ncbi:MAG: hypothetical protein KDD78_17450, partial [Caldilineaceae bacterium]|nr:hypothetical protein [Caldilineaceae bacterium]
NDDEDGTKLFGRHTVIIFPAMWHGLSRPALFTAKGGRCAPHRHWGWSIPLGPDEPEHLKE